MSMQCTQIFNSDCYEDGRTKQAFADSCDIERIINRAQKGEAISHLARYGAMYGDFTEIGDLMEAHNHLMKGQQIFDDLPGEVKREFHNSPAKFFAFVNDPNNVDRLGDILPGLTKPGNQLPAVRRNPKSEAVAERAAASVQDAAAAPQGGENTPGHSGQPVGT